MQGISTIWTIYQTIHSQLLALYQTRIRCIQHIPILDYAAFRNRTDVCSVLRIPISIWILAIAIPHLLAALRCDALDIHQGRNSHRRNVDHPRNMAVFKSLIPRRLT